MTIKEAELSQFVLQANLIMGVLEEFYEDDQINYNPEPIMRSVSFPLGMFIYEEDPNVWVYDIDFTFCTDKIDTIDVMIILQNVLESGVKIHISLGSQVLFNKDGLYTGSIYQSEVYDLMEEEDLTEKEAESILKKKAIKEFKDALKQKPKKVVDSV